MTLSRIEIEVATWLLFCCLFGGWAGYVTGSILILLLAMAVVIRWVTDPQFEDFFNES